MDHLHSAQGRLAFDEIFLLQLGVIRQKQAWQANTAQKFTVTDEWLQNLYDQLPYPLTSAQLNAIADIRSDLASGQPMNRLLQGDVGSGNFQQTNEFSLLASPEESKEASTAPALQPFAAWI